MYLEQIPTEYTLFFIIYGGTALAPLIASLYLCLRKGNAIAADVTSPMPLRRWAAAFFALGFLSHVWWLLFYINSGNINSVSCVVCAVLDSVGLLTTIPGMLFAMLQDRKRSVWPFALATIPYAVLGVLHLVYPGDLILNMAIAYIMSVYVLFTIYMVFAVRQYGRWLRDNYADLEHKEIWLSHVLVIAVLLLIIADGFECNNIIIACFVQAIEIVFFGLLLWRVETVPQLESSPVEPAYSQPEQETSQLSTQNPKFTNLPSNIEQLLDERCVGTQLYLQHDLSLLQLAQTIGINRFYLSQYFSRQGITYNAYINDLRINHFMRLYLEAADACQPITAQHLASDSGYRSYSTFSLAFKQRMGQSVTAWMREVTK